MKIPLYKGSIPGGTDLYSTAFTINYLHYFNPNLATGKVCCLRRVGAGSKILTNGTDSLAGRVEIRRWTMNCSKNNPTIKRQKQLILERCKTTGVWCTDYLEANKEEEDENAKGDSGKAVRLPS